MLELHHGPADPDTLKLMIALGEAGAECASVAVDVAGLAQWRAPHRDLAPNGELPVLVADGDALTDPTSALQYVAEAYGGGRLAPADALGWYDVQAWLNKVDPVRGPVNLLGWHLTTEPAERSRYLGALATVDGRKRLAGWSAVVEDAEASENQLSVARDRIGELVAKIEAQLAKSEWLAGDDYSIADIAAFSLLQGLPRLTPELVDAAHAPQLHAWLARIAERPAVQAVLAAYPGDHYAPPG